MGVSTRSEPRRSGSRDHGFHALRVRRIVTETPEAVSIVLDVPADLEAAFAYQAGQFVTFRLPIGGQQMLRSYSMSSSPQVDDEMAVTVKRVAGGVVSNWIADTLSAGDTLESTRPAGVFCLRPGSADVLAYAGGSGITPVYSLLKTALTTTGRRVRLLYANRDRESAIFAAGLDCLAERFAGRLEVVHHFDAEGGFVEPETIRRHAGKALDSEVFVCGPGPFMDLVESALHEQGIGPSRIHIERFTPAGLAGEPEPPEAAAASHAGRNRAGRPGADDSTPSRDDHPADGTPDGAHPAVLVRGGRLCHLHGPAARRNCHDAREQCPDRRRGG